MLFKLIAVLPELLASVVNVGPAAAMPLGSVITTFKPVAAPAVGRISNLSPSAMALTLILKPAPPVS